LSIATKQFASSRVGINNFAASVEFQYSNPLSNKISWHALVGEGSNDETITFDGGMFTSSYGNLSIELCSLFSWF